MKEVPVTNWTYFNNILYVGDDAKECIQVMERFNNRLFEIEKRYPGFFFQDLAAPDKLQRHIQYHFEGGVVMFRFRNSDDLPDAIRNECSNACRDLAYRELLNAS